MIVFAGPSVPAHRRTGLAGIDWRPPACGGDLLSLAKDRPEKVLLIDGRFEERASVQHKEALALMAAGTKLYGAASMGALRAAELSAFGMLPLGRIAAAYRSSLLVGDDEVALVHGDERIEHRAVSVAMVDVRATLCRAVRDRTIDRGLAKALRACWHSIHYVDRDWPAMLDAAAGIAPAELLRTIADNAVSLKEQDASDAIRFAHADRTPAPMVPPVPQTFFLRTLTERL